MKSGMRPGQTPAFHELGEFVFQDLCRDLLDAEPDITNCEVYGKRGELQYGIDLLAQRKGGGIEVGQCKCYEEFPPAKIKEASDDFLEHLERWSKANVKRFILMVACDLEKTLRQDEVLRQTERFRERGIEYEAWSAAKIRNKLRTRPDLVANYCKPAEVWVQEICGKSLPAVSTAAGNATVLVPAMLMAQMEALAGHLSNAKERELEQAREAWREGRHTEAVSWVRVVKTQGSLWSSLAPAVRAKILRFEASLMFFHSEGIEQAKALATEARALAPYDDATRLDALWAYAEHRIEDAVLLLEGRRERESREFLAGLLIEAGRLSEAWQLLENDDIKTSAEGLRLRALAHLIEKRLAAAEDAAQKALELQPRWESTQLAVAIVNYHSALSPCALGGLGPWPEPVSWRFVRRDEESLRRLRSAEKVFGELTSRAERPHERQALEVWQLACLLNDASRQDEATSFCQKIILRDPGHAGAVLWANARRLELDFVPSTTALQHKVETNVAGPADILALASIYLIAGRMELATLLERTQSIFEKTGLHSVWSFWQAQAMIMNGQPEGALKLAEQLGADPLADRIMEMALHARGESVEERGRLVQFLEERLEATGEPVFLLDACTIKARQREWAYVAERAERLVEEVCTLDALHLAVSCAYNAKRFGLCLKLLDKHQSILPSGRLTCELRRVRAACLESLGGMAEAVLEGEALIREEPTLTNLLQLASTLVSMGDIGRLAVVAREIESHPDLDAEHALQLAKVLQPQEGGRAERFVRRAIELGLPDGLVGNALALAMQLGMRDASRDLQLRMQLLAQQGSSGFRLIGLNELLAQQERYRKDTTHFEDLYQKGALPIHVLAKWAKQPLAILFHQMLSDNEEAPSPKEQPSLLIRSGRRPLITIPPNKPAWRIWLDVSAVLLAEHLDILAAVERTFSPLGIPPSLIPALVEMRAQVEHPQPERMRRLEKLCDLVERGDLVVVEPQSRREHFNQPSSSELSESWLEMFSLARQQNGFLVDFLPVHKVVPDFGPAALPEGAERVVASCWSILEALSRLGGLSVETHRAGLEALGTYGDPDEGVLPRAGSTLFCRPGILEVLVDAGMLTHVLAGFKVCIGREHIEELRAELRAEARRREIGRWIGLLIERLRSGIVDGRYERLPVVESSQAEEPDDARNYDLSVKCIGELLLLNPPNGTAVWFDDRWLHAHTKVGEASIVGVAEMLAALEAAGTLESTQYFEKLARLRSANTRFIPLSESELLHELRRSNVQNGVVVETPELAVLRRSFSTCLWKFNSIQLPNAAGDFGEITFIQDSARAIDDAIVSLWKDGLDDGTDRARATWLLSEMHVDLASFAKSSGMLFSGQSEIALEASDLMRLLLGAFELQPPSRQESSKRRREYLSWLFQRLLSRRLAPSPATLKHMAREMSRHIAQTLRDEEAEDIRAAIAEMFWDVIEDFPFMIRREVKRNQESLLDFRSNSWASVRGFQFRSERFWETAERAFSEGEQRLVTREGREIALRPRVIKGKGRALEIVPSEGDAVPVDDVALSGVLASSAERESVLRRHQSSLDLSDAEVQRILSAFPANAPRGERVLYFSALQDRSPSVLYGRLLRRLESRLPVSLDDLWLVDCEAMLHHHRLSMDVGTGSAFSAALESAAAGLEFEFGLEHSIRRLAGLPVPLPSKLLKKIGTLSKQERREVFRALVRSSGSPISKVHLIRLLWTFRRENPAYRRLAVRFGLRMLQSDNEDGFSEFLTILSWVAGNFFRIEGAHNCPPHLKLALAWSHAHHLWAVFDAGGVAVGALSGMLEREAHLALSDLGRAKDDERRDVAFPGRIERLSFVVSGFAYCFEGTALSELGVLGQRLIESIFPQDAPLGQRAPDLRLYKDACISRNDLCSFLGLNRGAWLGSLVEIEGVELLTSSGLEQEVGRILDGLLEQHGQPHGWNMVAHILDRAPIYPNLLATSERAITSVDWVSLLNGDIRKVLMALCAACSFTASSMRREIHAHMRKQWDQVVCQLELQRSLGAGEGGLEGNVDAGFILGLLFVAARELAAANDSASEAVSEFAVMLSRLADSGHFGADRKLRIGVENTYSRLPSSLRPVLWPLLMRLRAAHEVGFPFGAVN